MWQTGIIKAPQRDFCRILDGAVEETAGDRETLAAAIGAYQGLDTLAVSPVCAVGGSISWTGSPQSRYHLLRCDHATNGLIEQHVSADFFKQHESGHCLKSRVIKRTNRSIIQLVLDIQ